MGSWSKLVSDEFHIPQDDILQLFTKEDTHNSDYRTRENWKYGSSIGVSGTPVAFINGVMLDDFPTDEAGWESLIASLFPKTENFMQ